MVDEVKNAYGEFKRVENSLKNFSESIQNNLERLGYEDPHKQLFEKASQIPNPRGKTNLSENQKEYILRLFENMWMNELFLYQSEEIFGTKYIHFFYLEYICFYYSLFIGISIMERIKNPNQGKIGHEKKISIFNRHIKEYRIFRDLYFPPFNLIVSDRALQIKSSRVKCDRGEKILKDWIDNYDELLQQTRLENGERIIPLDKSSLRVCKSLIKYCNEKNKYDFISFLHYFMNLRHFFHYRVSSIYEGHKYSVEGMVKENRSNMMNILNISNFFPELFFYIKNNISDLVERKEIFCKKLLIENFFNSINFSFLEKRMSFF